MYNRYVPQQDGSHRRNRVAESAPPPPLPHIPSPNHRHSTPEPAPSPHHKPPTHGSPIGFLKQLLPKDFDTGDLIVVLLLLLMAGDKPEDRNTALLTLALYCFL